MNGLLIKKVTNECSLKEDSREFLHRTLVINRLYQLHLSQVRNCHSKPVYVFLIIDVEAPRVDSLDLGRARWILILHPESKSFQLQVRGPNDSAPVEEKSRQDGNHVERISIAKHSRFVYPTLERL